MADEDLSTDTVEAGDEVVTAEDTQQADQQDELSEVDQFAVDLGWRPKSEWTGPEGEWTDSKTFLRKTRDINRTMSRELKDMKKQMDGIGRATSLMTTQALAQQRRELLAARKEAFDAGDEDTFQRVDDALKDLGKAEVPDASDGMTAEGREWTEKHSSWFGKDKEATAYAAKRADKYAKEGLSPARQLAAVEADMKKHFPDLFPEEKGKATPHTPTLARPQRSATPPPKEKGYATLPPQARKACDDWASEQKENNGWDDKRAADMKKQWATSYYEQEATNG